MLFLFFFCIARLFFVWCYCYVCFFQRLFLSPFRCLIYVLSYFRGFFFFFLSAPPPADGQESIISVSINVYFFFFFSFDPLIAGVDSFHIFVYVKSVRNRRMRSVYCVSLSSSPPSPPLVAIPFTTYSSSTAKGDAALCELW